MKRTLIPVALAFVAGAVTIVLVAQNPFRWEWMHRAAHALLGSGTAVEGRAVDGLWTCSMHPEIVRDAPGSCPICGMELVPVEGASTVDAELPPLRPGVVRIDPVVTQNIGVRSEPVVRRDLALGFRTVGHLKYDESQMHSVNAKFEGWVETAHANYVGERVRRGDPLLEIYSPDLVATQKEYLQALDYAARMDQARYPEVAERARSLVEAARERLSYWDVGSEAVRRLEESKEVSRAVTLVSPVDGIVLEKASDSLEGMFARRGTNLYKLVDLSRIWAEVAVYESQMAHVRVGQRVRVEIPSEAGMALEGRVELLEPSLNQKSRTLAASIELPNPAGRLRDKMFVDVFFDVPAARNVLTVPDEAVLHSGLRNVVVVDLGGGAFEARDVELGVNAEERWEVTDGLEEGERVVVSAQFLIDSESNLKAAIRRLTPEPAEHVH